MPTKITTQFGHAVPTVPGQPPAAHAVTVHVPEWKNVERYGADSRSVIASFHNAYPRMKPHRDIAKLASVILDHLKLKNHGCYLCSSLQSAKECVEYCTSPRRDNGDDKKPINPKLMQIRAFKAKDTFYAVLYPSEGQLIMGGFWSTPGVGISSRFAEANLAHLDTLVETDPFDTQDSRAAFETPAHQTVRERIISHLNRAPLLPQLRIRPTPDDVYFFPTGMAAIYKPHTYLSALHNGTTVLFGMAFINTIAALQEFGAGYKFLGHGTDADILSLEHYLSESASLGRKVQAIWAEFPANPILVTPNLTRLRELSDKYDVVLAIDDTIGSFANVDITHATDLLVTSLTKSFNGYADAIAGSVVLNPTSRKYGALKALFARHYVPELYVSDIETIERNSRDYLVRTAQLNHNASSLVSYLATRAAQRTSSILTIHHPSLSPSGTHYRRYLRPSTQSFTPGYGCLFNIEFKSLAATVAFYDTLAVHDGPHLGAPFTLAFAYSMSMYATKLAWAEGYGLRPTQIRISAGLEETPALLEEFRVGVDAADRAWAASARGGEGRSEGGIVGVGVSSGVRSNE